MPAFSSSALLGWVLLTAPVDATEQSPLPICETSTRHLALAADGTHKPTEVCIRPGLSLTLFFDTKLARVDVQGKERFRRVTMGDDMLTLVASEGLRDGERVPVTVSFQEGTPPASATFVLVVHPSQAERQVEVSRHERTWASEQQARAEAQQCREDKARLQAECASQGGLTGLILNGWLGEAGVVTRKLEGITSRSAISLAALRAISYRAPMPKGRQRVAVEVELSNWGAVAWTPSGASLVGARGEEFTELKVAPLTPIPPGSEKRIVVELDVSEDEVRGSFSLKLWAGDSRADSLTLEGVAFP